MGNPPLVMKNLLQRSDIGMSPKQDKAKFLQNSLYELLSLSEYAILGCLKLSFM